MNNNGKEKDVLTLGSKLMRGLVGRLIEKSIEKKYNTKVSLDLKNLNITVIDGEAYVHINADATFDANRLPAILG